MTSAGRNFFNNESFELESKILRIVGYESEHVGPFVRSKKKKPDSFTQ